MKGVTCYLLAGTLACSAEVVRYEFDIYLHDDSRLIGTVEGSKISVKTDLEGQEFPLSFRSLRRIEFHPQKESFVFLLRNDDELLGTPGIDRLALQSSIGLLDVPFSEIRSIDLTPPPALAPVALERGLVVHFDFEKNKGGALANLCEKTPAAKVIGPM